MAEIRPFGAMRFTEKAGRIEELTCPPYDIISEEQRRGYISRNPHNIIRLELPRDGENPYACAGDTLRGWIENGILGTDTVPALYVYEIEFTTGEPEAVHREIMGLVTLVKLEEFDKGIVLPHEETLSKAKTDRFNLMKATGCNFSSIYSLYMDDSGGQETLDTIITRSRGEAIQCMTDEAGLIHRLWAITNETAIAAICARFTDIKLYIADGHHRYETALNYRNYLREQGAAADGASDYVMMMLVEMNHPGLVVFPTHRLVHGLPKFDMGALLDACGEYFEISAPAGLSGLDAALNLAYSQNRSAFALYAGGDVFTLLTLRDAAVMDKLLPGLSSAARELDVTVLHSLVLERLMGIDKENMANQVNLKYTRDLSEAVAEVDNGGCQCAFILNPTRVSEIRDVASAGEKMPQKSTYFYPKLITGLTMNKM